MKKLFFSFIFLLVISSVYAQPSLRCNLFSFELIHQSPYVPRSIKLQHVKSVKKYEIQYEGHLKFRDTTKKQLRVVTNYNENGQMTDSIRGLDLPNQKFIEAHFSYRKDGLQEKTRYTISKTITWAVEDSWCLKDSDSSYSVVFDFFYDKNKNVSIRRSCGDGSHVATVSAGLSCTYAGIMTNYSDTLKPEFQLYYPLEYDYGGHFINKSVFFRHFKVDSISLGNGYIEYTLDPCLKGFKELLKIRLSSKNQLVSISNGYYTTQYRYRMFNNYFEPILTGIISYSEPKSELSTSGSIEEIEFEQIGKKQFANHLGYKLEFENNKLIKSENLNKVHFLYHENDANTKEYQTTYYFYNEKGLLKTMKTYIDGKLVIADFFEYEYYQ